MKTIYKKNLFFLFLFFLNSPLFAQTVNQTTQTILPLQFNTGNSAPYGMPSTTINIQGKTIPILFDTGASKSEITLSPYTLKGIQVTYTGKQLCSSAMDGRYCEKEFIIPELKIGSFVLKNVTGRLMPKLWGGHDEGFKATEASRDGVIGLALLSKFNVLLDFPHNKAVLVKMGSKISDYPVTDWTAIPFQKPLLTQLKINGIPMTLGWDTGAVPSIIKQSKINQANKVPCPQNTPWDKKNCLRIETKSFTTLKNKKLPDTWFKVTDIPNVAPFDGLVGSNFYMKNIVYFDFDNHILYIQ